MDGSTAGSVRQFREHCCFRDTEPQPCKCYQSARFSSIAVADCNIAHAQGRILMKRFLFGTFFAALSLIAQEARAADDSIVDFSWSRCFGGVTADFSSSHIKTQIPWSIAAPPALPTGPTRAMPKATGFGVHAGCNVQLARRLVLGVEGQVLAPGVKERQVHTSAAAPPTPPQLLYRRTEDLHFALAARAGAAINRSLIFGKAGVAFGNFDYAIPAPTRHGGCGVGPCPPVIGGQSSSEASRAGLLLGGGLEYALTDSWTAKAEYQRVWFGRRFASGAGANTRLRMFETRNAVKVGLNFLFDARP